MTTETNAPTFKDRNRALQELVREYMVLREHNLQFKEGDDLRRLLLFSEAAIVIVIIEHFVRMVLGALVNRLPVEKCGRGRACVRREVSPIA